MCNTPTALRYANVEEVNETTIPACLRHSENKEEDVHYARINVTRKGRKSKKENRTEENVGGLEICTVRGGAWV